MPDLDKFEARVSEATEPAKAKLQPQVDKARASYDKAVAKLREMRDAGGESWDDMSGEIEHVWKTLKQSVNYFKSQL